MRQSVTLHKETKKLKKGIAAYWVLRWYDADGKRRNQGLGRVKTKKYPKGLSEREARKLKSRKEHEFESCPGQRTPTKLTVKQYTDKYFVMRKNEVSEATIQNYKISVRYLIYYFGENKPINDISAYEARAFKAALAANELSDAMERKADLNRISVNLHLRQIKAVFSYAINDLKLIQTNPFSGTTETVKQSTRWHYVTQNEFQKVLEAATDNYRIMITLCRLAGLRRKEAYYLEWQDVNFEKSRLYVVGKDEWQPKSRETRVIPMCPELQTMLLDAFQKAPDGTVRVCPQIYIGNVSRDMKATIKRAGVKPWSKPLHTLRKSCITDWAGRYPIHAVKEWAGHADISTTEQYYLQVTEDQYTKAAASSFWNIENVTEKETENEKGQEKEEKQSNEKSYNQNIYNDL